MNQAVVLDLGRQAVLLIIMCAAPMLVTTLIIGLVVSIVQAMTQVQEQSLIFVPKVLGVFLALALFGPWILNTMLTFTSNLFSSLPALVR
jgi:flagellar biosynthetic protein FliQ